MSSLVPRIYDFGDIRLIRFEELRRVDGCVCDCALGNIGGCLDVWEEESNGVRWLCGEDG